MNSIEITLYSLIGLKWNLGKFPFVYYLWLLDLFTFKLI